MNSNSERIHNPIDQYVLVCRLLKCSHTLSVTVSCSVLVIVIVWYQSLLLVYQHHDRRFNVLVSMLSLDWTIPPQFDRLWSECFYRRISFLTPTLPTLKTNEGFGTTMKSSHSYKECIYIGIVCVLQKALAAQ